MNEAPAFDAQLMFWPHVNHYSVGVMGVDPSLPPDLRYVFFVQEELSCQIEDCQISSKAHVHPAIEHFMPMMSRTGSVVWVCDPPRHPSIAGRPGPRSRFVRERN